MSDKPERRGGAMIQQTPFGRFLCWLGMHLVITSGENPPWSTWGGCIRCNRAWQWDNPGAGR